MDRRRRQRPNQETPDWLINSLKVLLIGVFCWQFSQQVPEGYLATLFESTPPPPPPIESIEYQHLLGTTTTLIPHYLHWGDQLIPYQEPELSNSTSHHFEIPAWKTKELSQADWTLSYKGQNLTITKINAIFLKDGLLPIICEEAVDSTACFTTTLRKLEKDFELWVALETEEKKLFYSKIKVGKSPDKNSSITTEAMAFWKKMIKKEKFKDIDKLTVVKPIFRENGFLFKWGNWERMVQREQWETKIKVDTATFNNWLRTPPNLYSNGTYIPFSFYINFWNRNRWNWDAKRGRSGCRFDRSIESASILESYPCFELLRSHAKVGDVFSFSLHPKEDFLDKISPANISGIPPFILNGRRIGLYFNIELVADPIDATHHPLDLATSEFAFQLSTLPGQKAKVKMDTMNPKNHTLLEYYSNSETTEVLHIPNFKTIRRLITANDQFIQASDIDHTYTLVDKVYAVHTFPEFYDFNVFPPLIKSRGLSTVLNKTSYPVADFVNYRNPFEMWIGTEKVKVLQTNITIIPKEGDIIRYITDNPDRFDINRRLDQLEAESSVYFDDILFERENGEQLAFPLAVALHLK